VPVLGVVVLATGPSGPVDPLRPLSGVPILTRTVRAVVGTPGLDRVEVLAPGAAGPALEACSGLPVGVHDDVGALLRVVGDVLGAHARQRRGAAGGDGSAAGVLVVHDAARPLAPPGSTAAVVAAVRGGHRAAVPVLPLSDTVKQVDGEGRPTATPDRSGLRVVQTPQAFAADLAPAVLAAALEDTVRAWTGVGGTVHTVPGDPLALAVHDPWDLALAEAALRETGVRAATTEGDA
jgi:2-C-methyl-D-erythritol 4-phosphate cytidylyltransferase